MQLELEDPNGGALPEGERLRHGRGGRDPRSENEGDAIAKNEYAILMRECG